MSLRHDPVRAESGLLVAELDVTRVRLMEVELMTMKLETMRLGRKFKNCLSLKIRLKKR